LGSDKDKSMSAAELLRRAEERLNTQTEGARMPRTENEAQRLLHELQVHKVELELQIEELRQARVELDTALDKYTDLYDFAPVGYFTINHDGIILAANLTGAALLGVERSRLIGQHFGIYIPEKEKVVFADFREKVFASLNKESCVVTLARKGNSPLFAHIVATAFGQECRFAVIDITERLRMVDSLRESEDKFVKIFDSVPVGITISTLADGKFVDINEEGERLSGYRRDEVVGRTALEFNIWKDPLERARMIEDIQKQGVVHNREMKFIDKSGNVLSGLFSATIIDIKGKKHLLSMVSDISERKRAEEERERTLLKLEAVLENICEGVVISDLGGYIQTMNREALVLHEIENIEEVRQHFSEFQKTFELFDLEERPLSHKEWPLARVLRGERFADNEVRVRNKVTGKSWVWSYSGSQVHDKSGDIILTVITMHDITERKLAEAEIARLNVSLAGRAADLEVVNRNLEAFNYTVAHDLRQPLNVISSYCQVIKEMCGDKLDEQCLECLQKSYESTMHMNSLIEALLEFSRLADAPLKLNWVDLSSIAEQVAEELKASEPTRRVDIRIPDRIVAFGDALLVHVVLANLIGNAWKYTAAREEAVIEFGVSEIDGRLAYWVRDNGSGFDMANVDKLFTPFKRLPCSEEFMGFGIGLATVERIIRRHGGKIWAEGEPGKGATFYFTLGT